MKLAADIAAATREALVDLLDAVARLRPRVWVIMVIAMFLVNVFLAWGPSIHKVPGL